MTGLVSESLETFKEDNELRYVNLLYEYDTSELKKKNRIHSIRLKNVGRYQYMESEVRVVVESLPV